jgi:hypothetical protein
MGVSCLPGSRIFHGNYVHECALPARVKVATVTTHMSVSSLHGSSGTSRLVKCIFLTIVDGSLITMAWRLCAWRKLSADLHDRCDRV